MREFCLQYECPLGDLCVRIGGWIRVGLRRPPLRAPRVTPSYANYRIGYRTRRVEGVDFSVFP